MKPAPETSERPPHWATRLLALFCAPHLLEEVQGDLEERFHRRVALYGERLARRQYVTEVLGFLRPFALKRQPQEHSNPFFLSPAMLRNYLKIAWRNLVRYPAFSFINILGLAIGLACCLFILLYVQDESQFDRYHRKANRIYRINADLTAQGKTALLPVTPAPWAPVLTTVYAPGTKAVRLLKDKKSLVRTADKRFYENRVFLTDSTVFDVFTFPLLKGNPASALTAPNTVVLSEATARKYFGQADPMGKTLEFMPSFGRSFTLTVTGVASNLPTTSHLNIDFLVSLSTLGDVSQLWEFFMFHTYLLLPEGYAPQQLERQLPDFLTKYMGKYAQSTGKVDAHLQALTDIHLRSDREGELEPGGSILYVRVFSTVAVIILLIAAINFMNLSTARSLKRAKEVGLRKAVGAQRMELVGQFLGESVLLALLALVASVAFLHLVLPLFNQLAGKELPFAQLHQPAFLLSLLGLSLAVGIVAGLYPAVVLSYFKPAQVLKGGTTQGNRGQWLRKGLIVTQFGISSLLIIGTFVIYQQLNYIRNKKLGFDQQQIVVLSAPKFSDPQKATAFKNRLKQQSTVAEVAAASDVPGAIIPANTFRGEGSPLTQHQSMQMLSVDEDFVPALGMELTAGRNFSRDFPADAGEGFVLNEEAVRQLGWQSPAAAIGKKFERVLSDQVLKSGKVIGVVKDFNLKPLHTKVAPTVLVMEPSRFQYLYIRVKPGNPSTTLDFLQQQLRQFYPDQPVQFTFLNETIQAMYQGEARLGGIFSAFSTLAILIGCLGIFGLATYTAQQRIKEIGIRKVLGASTASVFALLSKEFLKLIVVALLIASPVAWWAMNRWLEGFAYHVAVPWWVFVLTGLLVMGIALLTVSVQSLKAALTNPVKSLRSE